MTRLRTGRARGFGAEMLRHGVLLSVLIAVTLIGYRSSSLTGIGDFNDVGLRRLESIGACMGLATQHSRDDGDYAGPWSDAARHAPSA